VILLNNYDLLSRSELDVIILALKWALFHFLMTIFSNIISIKLSNEKQLKLEIFNFSN